MSFKNLLLLIIATSLYACNWGVPKNDKPAVTKDTLAYTYKLFKERDPNCGDNPDSSCTIVKIKYPDFSDQVKLNDAVAAQFNKLFALKGKAADTSMKQLAESFIAGYTDFKKVQPKSTLYHLLSAHAKVLRQDSSLLTIEVAGYIYHGGPHGADYTSFVNWNTKAAKTITLADILIDGYQEKLNQAAEKIFRKEEKLSDTSSLTNNHDYFFKDKKFSLPDYYLITPLGIRFLYNVYTIKPYAAGQTDLLVPYDQIHSLIKPNTVIKQYIK